MAKKDFAIFVFCGIDFFILIYGLGINKGKLTTQTL